MAEDDRKFTGSISIRFEGNRKKIELAPAENYGGKQGLFRARVQRRWVNGQNDAYRFFDRTSLANFIAESLFEELISTTPIEVPDIPRGSRVSATFWVGESRHIEGVWTDSPVFRAFDGHYYVFVQTYEAGYIPVPVENITVHVKGRKR